MTSGTEQVFKVCKRERRKEKSCLTLSLSGFSRESQWFVRAISRACSHAILAYTYEHVLPSPILSILPSILVFKSFIKQRNILLIMKLAFFTICISAVSGEPVLWVLSESGCLCVMSVAWLHRSRILSLVTI